MSQLVFVKPLVILQLSKLAAQCAGRQPDVEISIKSLPIIVSFSHRSQPGIRTQKNLAHSPFIMDNWSLTSIENRKSGARSQERAIFILSW